MLPMVSLILWSTLLTYHVISALSTLRLNVDPSFLQVKEDWKVGSALDASICASNAINQSILTITNGDPLGHFQLKPFNASCWSLILKHELDADQQNAQGTRGQTFSLTFQLSAGRLQTKGNLQVQVVDINDNAPRFVDTRSDVSISEIATPGTLVTTLTTFDPDIGVGGINTFRLQDNPDGKFRLGEGGCSNSKCKVQLFLEGALDYATRNSYKLTIVAVDGASRTERINPTEFSLVVNVIDVQNSPPRFITDGRPQRVPENVAIGTQVFQVLAQDGDTGADHQNPIRYNIAGEKRFFDINADTGWVYVTEALDRESTFVTDSNGAVNLTIEATEVNESADGALLTSRLDISVLITDVDDEAPQCNRSSYNVHISENSPLQQPLTVVGAPDITAFDLDQGPNAAFSVSLSGQDALWFDVSPKSVSKESTLFLRVRDAAGLDYEQSRSLSFDILLTPTTSNTKILPGRCAINVTILDANDNAPHFNQSTLVGSVPENEPGGTFVMSVTATDLDSDRFGPILYKITGNGAENFRIGSDGSIATTGSLDREKTAEYQLTLAAIDNAGRGNRDTIPLTITVQDVNDNAPLFERATYVAYLLEGSNTFSQYPQGFPVKAIDLDEPGTDNSRISYFILKDSRASVENFTIDSELGTIQPVGSVDLESMTDNYFNLSIRAQDHANHSLTSTAILLVYVNDTNDNSPQFDSSVYNVTIDEVIQPLTPILNVSASDADRSERNRQITYRIDDAQDRFVIDPKSGIISVGKRASFDLPSNPARYDVIVVALDNGSPQKTTATTVIINVNDVNDKPPRFAQSTYFAQVSEKAPPFTSLLNLTADDSDQTAIMHYNISGFSDAKTIDGRNVDDSPQPYDYAGRFGIRPHNGELFLRDTVDREQLESVVIHVIAMDINGEVNNPQTGETTVKVQVLDENDNAPVFEKSAYFATVQENAPRNSVVLSVSAHDTDSSDKTIRYSITAFTNPELAKTIAIDSAGIVRVAGLIDFELAEWINATLTAEDAHKNIGTATLSLQVIDQNDNSPVFHPGPSYTGTIAETAPTGSLVKLRGPNANVTATDRDSGSLGQVSYFLLNEADDGAAAFAIDRRTGAITTIRPLDRETKSTYSLTVRAVDDFNTIDAHPDSHEATAVVEITVEDANDNAPTFVTGTTTKLTLSENDVAGTQIAVFSATDRDAADSGNGKVRYFIVNGNATVTGKPMFALDPQLGALSLVNDLRGKFGRYYLVIEARDLGTPQSLSNNLSISIVIRDFNDHRPTIYNPAHQSIHLVKENMNLSNNNSIVQVKAMDLDEGDNAQLQYFFKKTAANEDWRFFLLDQNTGLVSANITFDYETKNRYTLMVAACDQGKPPQCTDVEFTVAVQDVNDECPYFEQEQNYVHRLSIPENQPVTSEEGVPVGQIPAARDDDGDEENRHACYRIEQNNDGKYAPFFLKAPDSRVLMTNESLDREAQASYRLRIRTFDCAQECTSTSVSEAPVITSDKTLLDVLIEVRDVNDNFPHFTQRTFRGGGVQGRTHVGNRVARVSATDADDSDAGQLRYEIKGRVRSEFENGYLDTDRQPFFINNTTGDIIANLLFQSDWKGNFFFVVAVVDGAGHEDTATVTINLLGYNQQIELVFGTSANSVWDNRPEIIRLLSEATTWNATIDDVRTSPAGTGAVNQSKVLVHFLDPNNSVISIDTALHTLDKPESEAQKAAKKQLIERHKLMYAGHTPTPTSIGLSPANMAIYFGVAGVVGGLMLVMVVLIAVWSCQNRSYKRKLKAATTLAFGTADPTVTAYDVPGTNLHATSNPVWTGAYETYGVGRDNYALDYDRHSENSLDRNALAKSATPRSINATFASSKAQFAAYRFNADIRPPLPVRHTEPEPDYPRELLASLESTEL